LRDGTSTRCCGKSYSSFRFFGQVHHTISTTSARTTAISSKMTHIARALSAAFAAIVLAAGCQQLPAPAERAAACPPCAPCPECPPAKPPPPTARYEPAQLSALPGWQSATLAPSLRAFVTGCAKIAPRSPLRSTCDAARAARRFFESAFSAHSITHTFSGLVQ